MASLNMRVDDALKKEAEELFAMLGLNMTTAVNIFLRQVVRCGGIPFEVKCDVPNAETEAAIRNVEKMKENPSAYKTYSDVDELMRDLLA